MELVSYLSNHLIVYSGFCTPEYLCSDAIVENPVELIFAVLGAGYHISHISWWDHVKVGNASPLGYGGTRDPRNPKFYFAETDICKDFSAETTSAEYCDYVIHVKKMYSTSNLFPAFDIRK